MELTRRQETFIRNLVDLYGEHDRPIHYPELAERLGVSPFTAYDMLRLLEERGYARSEYHLSDAAPEDGKRQSGRSIIVFAPTDKAHHLMADLSAEAPPGDLEGVKRVLLERVRSGRFPDVELAREVLARVPQDESPVLRYCTEVATVLTLRVWRAGRWQHMREYLEPLLLTAEAATRENLLLLAGFAVGALAGRADGDAAWLDEMSQHTQSYLGFVSEMGGDDCRRLASNPNAALSPLLGGAGG
jgi:DNA-binding MarR family transcriptional regulator